MIPVTKPFLPNINKYKDYVDEIYNSGWVTNNGPLVERLERQLSEYLGVKNILLVSSGTIALEMAYMTLELSGEVITTPFSFVATTSSLLTSNLTPIFADIDSSTLNIDVTNIQKSISSKTSAILPVHVFGNICEIEKIDDIAKKNNLKVIYDAAHAFGVKYKNDSVLNHGDISVVSFHATKIFHTIEGGALIINDDVLFQKAKEIRNFGIDGSGMISGLGKNGKMNEFEAAMGLCMLEEMENIKRKRKEKYILYKEKLADLCQFQKTNESISLNYSYFPVIFNDEDERKRVQKGLNENNIFPRRYFYPSLDTLEYIDSKQISSNSRSISEKILCLPLYPDLSDIEQMKIIDIIKESI